MPYYNGTMRWIIRSGHATPREKIPSSWLDNAENKGTEKNGSKVFGSCSPWII